MAFTTILMTVSMVAIASAGFPGWPDDDSPFPGFSSPMMSSLGIGPMAPPPSMPIMPAFPPNLQLFQFPDFPTMPIFPPMPTFADIASRGVPKDGETFSGVMMSSKMETKRNDDGTLVKEGGTSILTNVDGVVSMKQTGNNPPALPTNAPPFDSDDPEITPFNSNHFKNLHNLKFENFNNFGSHHKFGIDPKKIETYVPGKGETFKGKSFRTHSFSSNNNGKISEGGSETRIDNDNGHVNKEEVVYSGDGTES